MFETVNLHLPPSGAVKIIPKVASCTSKAFTETVSTIAAVTLTPSATLPEA